MYRIVHNEALNEIGKHNKVMTMPDNFDAESEEDLHEYIIKKEEQETAEGLDQSRGKHQECASGKK